jgi:flagellin
MSTIILSAGVRQNLLALQNTASLLSTTQGRLATGKRVNTALDDATTFFVAANLTTRSQDLNGLLDSIGLAMRTLEAADNGVTAITRLIENAQAITRQALQSAPTTARITGTVSNLTGTFTFATTAGNTLTVGDGTTTVTFTTAGTSTTVQQVLDLVNAAPALNIRASLTGDGRILLEATGTNTVNIGGSVTSTQLQVIGLNNPLTATAGTLNATRTSLASQYNELRNQIDKLAADASFNGVSLLNGGGLKVVFNEQATSYLTIFGAQFTSGSRTAGADNMFNTADDVVTALGINAAFANFQTDKDVTDSVGNLRDALIKLRAQASNLASNMAVIQTRQEFMKTMISTLRVGSDNLVLADPNEEGANILALQTRQQLSTTALSLSTQADQSVLRLFG